MRRELWPDEYKTTAQLDAMDAAGWAHFTGRQPGAHTPEAPPPEAGERSESMAWYLREQELAQLVAPQRAAQPTERGGQLASTDCNAAAYLHDYGEGRYLLIQMNHQRPEYAAPKAEARNSYDGKLANNVARARSTILGVAMCNEWDWFSTTTIDPTKYDRCDLDAYHAAYTQFVRHEARRIGKVGYMLVPEQHQKGGWHEHGLLQGLPVEELRPFTLDEKLPHYIRRKLREGAKVYDWPRYRERFGFCDFEPVYSRDAVACYITKYVTKTLANNVQKLGAHTYYRSKGLNSPQTVAAGRVVEWLPQTTQNVQLEHCTKQWFYGEAGLAEALSFMAPLREVERAGEDTCPA